MENPSPISLSTNQAHFNTISSVHIVRFSHINQRCHATSRGREFRLPVSLYFLSPCCTLYVNLPRNPTRSLRLSRYYTYVIPIRLDSLSHEVPIRGVRVVGRHGAVPSSHGHRRGQPSSNALHRRIRRLHHLVELLLLRRRFQPGESDFQLVMSTFHFSLTSYLLKFRFHKS